MECGHGGIRTGKSRQITSISTVYQSILSMYLQVDGVWPWEYYCLKNAVFYLYYICLSIYLQVDGVIVNIMVVDMEGIRADLYGARMRMAGRLMSQTATRQGDLKRRSHASTSAISTGKLANRPLGFERMYLPLSKNTPFHIQGDDLML